MSANGSSLQTQAVAATAASFSKPTPTFCAWSRTWNLQTGMKSLQPRTMTCLMFVSVHFSLSYFLFSESSSKFLPVK